MVKSVSRFSGLSAVCLIVTLIVPLIQCLPVEQELNSSDRFKRNVALTPIAGSSSEAIAKSSATTSSFPPYLPFLKGGYNFPSFHYGGGGGSNGLAGLVGGPLLPGLITASDGAVLPFQYFSKNDVLKPIANILGGTVGGLSKGTTGLLGGVNNAVVSLLGGSTHKAPGGYPPNSDFSALLSQLSASKVNTESNANAQAGSGGFPSMDILANYLTLAQPTASKVITESSANANSKAFGIA